MQVFGGDMIPTDETVNYSKLEKFKVSHTIGPQGCIAFICWVSGG